MKPFAFPNPMLDPRELELIEKLTEDYKAFTSPGLVSKVAERLRTGIIKLTPEKLRKKAIEAVNKAADWEFIKKALHQSARGFAVLLNVAPGLTLSHKGVVKTLRGAGCPVGQFKHICAKV